MADNLKKASNYCVVCSSNSKKNPQISFFRFPKDEKRCNEWKLKLHVPKLDNCSTEDCYKRYRVCSAHFEDCMFSSMQKNKLKLNAIPTRLIEVDIHSISQPKASELPVRRILKQTAAPIMQLGEKIDENVVEDTPIATKASEKHNQKENTQPDLSENGESDNDNWHPESLEEGSENEEVANETETSLDDDDSWSCLETSALIATYGQHRNSFTRDGHELLAWDHISADLSSKNIHKTPESCEKKWKALFQIYLFNKRKPNRINFEYQNEIDEVIGDERVEAENGKRKRVCECSERKISEKNRRHRERMEMMKGKLDIEKQKLAAFQQYLAYLESRGD